MNPYTGYGVVVSGERLVGRAEQSDKLVEELRAGAGSISLVGEPRVGKSSLARLVLGSMISGTPDNTSVFLDLGTVGADESLFAIMCRELQGHVDLEVSETSSESKTFRELKRGLMRSRRSGRRIYLVLDEFDNIRFLPSPQLAIRRLREVLSSPQDFGLHAVLVSRRRLAVLERQISNLSTLDGVCAPHFVRPLGRRGLIEMILRGWPTGWQEGVLDGFFERTGGQPFVCEALLYSMADGASLTEAFENQSSLTNAYFENLSNLIQEDGSWGTLRQVMMHGEAGLGDDVNLLRQYGVVVSRNGKLQIFSGLFSDFLLRGQLTIESRAVSLD